MNVTRQDVDAFVKENIKHGFLTAHPDKQFKCFCGIEVQNEQDFDRHIGMKCLQAVEESRAKCLN